MEKSNQIFSMLQLQLVISPPQTGGAWTARVAEQK